MSSARLFPAQPRGGIGIDAEVAIERDAVVLSRRRERNVAARDVVAHPIDLALKRIAPAAAAGELHRQEIATLEQQARALGRQRACTAACEACAALAPNTPREENLKRSMRRFTLDSSARIRH